MFLREVKENENYLPRHLCPRPEKDIRLFDSDRDELSLHLPEIVRTLPEQFCYHGGYSRYFSCKIHKDDGTEIHY